MRFRGHPWQENLNLFQATRTLKYAHVTPPSQSQTSNLHPFKRRSWRWFLAARCHAIKFEVYDRLKQETQIFPAK